MDYTDEELVHLLGEECDDQSDLLAQVRAELMKAPVLSSWDDKDHDAALFLTRISFVLRDVRKYIQRPSDTGGWLAEDRLRIIFMSACGMTNTDIAPYQLDRHFTTGLRGAVANTWLEAKNEDIWDYRRNGVTGSFKKYCVTPLGKRQVLRKDGAAATEASKPNPVTETVPAWQRSTPQPPAPVSALSWPRNPLPPPPTQTTVPDATAPVQATVSNNSHVCVAPHIAVHLHVAAPTPAPSPVITPPPAPTAHAPATPPPPCAPASTTETSNSADSAPATVTVGPDSAKGPAPGAPEQESLEDGDRTDLPANRRVSRRGRPGPDRKTLAERKKVFDMRGRGKDWADIAGELNITKQAAEKMAKAYESMLRRDQVPAHSKVRT